MKKSIVIAVAMLFTLSSGCQAAGTVQAGGEINWYKGENTPIRVIGVGIPPTVVTSILQSEKIAREAALSNAHDILTKMINELQVDSRRTMYDLTIANETAREKLAGLIKQAKLIKWKEDPEGAYLGFQVNVFGADGVTKIALEALKTLDSKVAPRSATNSRNMPDSMTLEDVYSGVIVDARNLGFTLNLLPKIYDTGGRLIYDYRDADSDSVSLRGLVEYARNVANISGVNRTPSRAGVKPIMVKALKVADNGCNIIISTEDADKIIEQNKKWKFLHACLVVIVL